VVRAARHDLPLALAIIGGDPEHFRPYVDLYNRVLAEFGRPAKEIAVHSSGYVATTDEAAREEYWPPYKGMHDPLAPSAAGRGSGAPTSSARSSTERSTSAPRKRSHARSPRLPMRYRALPQIQRRHAGTRKAHALHRALWQQGDPLVCDMLA